MIIMNGNIIVFDSIWFDPANTNRAGEFIMTVKDLSANFQKQKS